MPRSQDLGSPEGLTADDPRRSRARQNLYVDFCGEGDESSLELLEIGA